jgi:hypothetical protein
MKRFILISCFLTSSAFASAPKIANYRLSETVVYQVLTAPGRTTTLVFPDTIEMIDGKGLVSDVNKAKGNFELGFLPNTNYISLSPIVAGAATNLNVSTGGKIYCLEIHSTENEATYKVTFTNQENTIGQATVEPSVLPPKVSEFGEAADLASKKKVSVARMIGLMDKARAYPLLAAQKDNPVKDLAVSFPGKNYELNGVQATLLGVYRDNSFDGICFSVRFKATDNKPHFYDPESFKVQVGNQEISAFVSAASGEIPAEGEIVEYFTIAGDGMGGRNDLAPTNDFSLSINFTNGKRVTPSVPLAYAETKNLPYLPPVSASNKPKSEK